MRCHSGSQYAISIFLLIAALPTVAASLFDTEAPLEVEIEGPFRSLFRANDEEERPFVLRHEGDDFDIQIRVRGQTRRIVCDFPPLRVDFRSEQVEGTVFEGQDKLKLVTHCKSGRSYEANLLEEYNAYRILNQITDTSFRVRLLHVSYIDGRRLRQRFAFVIEDVDALATRLGGQHVEPPYVSKHDLEAAHATRIGLFQFLIGNTDFSMTAPKEGHSCCHNAKLIETPKGLYSIPYDFDQAGVVNAPYAAANPVLDIRDVRRRVYRGFCTDSETLAAALEDIFAIRDSIGTLFESTPGMRQRDARRAHRYLDRFFERVEKRGTREFEERCR